VPEYHRTRGQKARQAKLQASRENGIIQDAIKEATLERLRTRIEQRFMATAETPPIERTKDRVARALPHVQTKSSKKWVLEALGGHETNTPGTGNCQFYALAEAICQQVFQE
jgi:hypothetical protein